MLVIDSSFQLVNYFYSRVNEKELVLEELLKLNLQHDGRSASIQFLMEYIFELFQEIVSYKEKQGLKNFILVIRVWSIRITE